MIIDKNGKLFGKINLIDFAVILLIIVAMLGIGLRFFSKAAMEVKETVKISYTAEVENVRIYSIDALKKSSDVLNQGNIVGKITDITYDAYTTPEIDSEGKMVMAKNPDRYKAEIKIVVDGNVTDKGYFVGENSEISVGSTTFVETKYIKVAAKVKDIKIEE